MGTYAVAVLLMVAAPSPVPARTQTKVSSVLFESPDAAEECRVAMASMDKFKAAMTEADREHKKIDSAYVPATKPVAELNDEELAAWRKQRAEQKAAKAAISARLQAAALESKTTTEAEAICRRATTAELSKGIELTVLKSPPGSFLSVRVESGRATGKVGWVLRSDVHRSDVH